MPILGPGLVNIILVLGVSGWVAYGRVVRGQVLQLRASEFSEAARAIGANHWRVVFRHVLPNAIAPIIVIATFMVAEGRDYLQVAWWSATFPGLAITLTVLGVNVLGDWLRDVLDPRLRV